MIGGCLGTISKCLEKPNLQHFLSETSLVPLLYSFIYNTIYLRAYTLIGGRKQHFLVLIVLATFMIYFSRVILSSFTNTNRLKNWPFQSWHGLQYMSCFETIFAFTGLISVEVCTYPEVSAIWLQWGWEHMSSSEIYQF